MIGMEQRLSLKLATKLVMTPNLQLAIKLLQLNKIELIETINKELQENPAFDLESVSVDPVTADSQEVPGQVQKDANTEATDNLTVEEKNSLGEMDWESYFDNGADYGYFPTEEKSPIAYENIIHRSQNLAEHLLWQLSLTRLNKEEQYLGLQIIGNLNDDGYLMSTVDEIVQKTKASPEDVEAILTIIQTFDPLGVGARDLKECLLLQIRHSEFDVHPHAEAIIEHHLPDLQKNAIRDISKNLGISVDDVQAAVEFIRTLEPKPGRVYSVSTTQYIQPDVYIFKVDQDYKIVLNETGLPKLKINKLYQQYKAKGTDAETKQYVEQKFRNALWLIKSVEQRQRTIYKVAESILKFQIAFFKHGIKELRPLVLRDVAEDIEMHESTVSRVSTNKYIHTPQGIFEIKFFFHSGLSTLHGEDVSSIRVKEMIKNLILNENPRSPLSDRAIMLKIQDQGINIARRTIAKYREELKIPPSNRRRSV
jgi:RNA polymerase sigma-54 factor